MILGEKDAAKGLHLGPMSRLEHTKDKCRDQHTLWTKTEAQLQLGIMFWRWGGGKKQLQVPRPDC